MVYKFDIHVVHLSELKKHWWQLAILSLGLTAAFIGILYIGTKLILKVRRLLRLKSLKDTSTQLALNVRTYFQTLNTVPIAPCVSERSKVHNPTSFRIYLGALDDLASGSQSRILSDWDLVILDPLQPGVKNAITSTPRSRRIALFILGRLDIEALLGTAQHDSDIEDFTIYALDCILGLVSTYFPVPNERNHGFTGIVLAGWENLFSVATLHELSKELSKRALDVYLETKPPHFLNEVNAVVHNSIAGLVIRNGLLWPNGERRDCFNMDEMRPTIKAFMSQEIVREFTTMMWEELDNNAVVSISVLKRTYSWSRFHNTLAWIAPSYALLDAEAIVTQLEPLSAFDWLKESSVTELHDLWKNNQTVSSASSHRLVFGPINTLLPTLRTMWKDNTCNFCESSEATYDPESESHEPEWTGLDCFKKTDTLSVSETGFNYDGVGCFPIGINVTVEDFVQVVHSQRRLRKLGLLDEIAPNILKEFGILLGDFVRSKLVGQSIITSQIRDTILQLSRNLTETLDRGINNVRVYQGLDTGFHSAGAKRFWGVYYIRESHGTEIYISSKSEDVIGTILHTYLSSRYCPRRQRFEAEFALADWSGTLAPSRRSTKQVQQDIRSLTPSESLILLQKLALYDLSLNSSLVIGVRDEVEAQLIKQPSKTQLKSIGTVDYLNGSVDAKGLIFSRIASHCQHGLRHPSQPASLQLFSDVEEAIQQILRDRRISDLESIIMTLRQSMKYSCADTVTDILALAVFCVMRKLAFEEVYIEVTDRNPLFNDQSDQGAAFAELFALGSRCEVYFDMSPSAFGKLLLLKFREQYNNPLRQPPLFKETSMALQTAYSEPQMDIAPISTSMKMPSYQRFTFMGVFAIPALIDVLLLTTTKHGLFLSGKMSEAEQKYATIAFMLSLPLSGAIGTWIACGGTYYLASMAFSAMNYLVVTRLLGGLVFLVSAATIGFVAISCVTGVQPALIFFLYLIALTAYLSLLAALANYNLNGSSFQSGRKIILLCIPVMFLSPVTTILIPGYDSEVYLAVLYVFITMLLLGTRHIGSLWTTWFQKIEIIDDKALKDWYLERKIMSEDRTPQVLSEHALLKQAQQDMLREVMEALPSLFNFRTTKDPMVLKLAECYEATSFMMDWYSLSTGLPTPIPFSSTWNIQSKVALKQLVESQRGIRFHNCFLHWRQAGDEIACTVLYFIVALLDKWIALLGGKQSISGQKGGILLGLTSNNPEFGHAVGFGLAYYLIGAVLLDYNAQKLHELATKCKQEIVANDDCLLHATREVARERSALYWKTLRLYLLLDVWSLAITSAMMLLFSYTKDAIILFLAYVFSYTGLLWYQYTKTFAGPHALKPLLISASLGLIVGFVLRSIFPNFIYSDVVALGFATWLVAILCLWAVRIVGRSLDEPIRLPNTGYHVLYNPGPDASWSQSELRLNYDLLRSLPDDKHPLLDPKSYQGQQIQLILSSASREKLSDLAGLAFPSAGKLFENSLRAFQDQKVVVELVSMKYLNEEGHSTRAISYATDDLMRVLVDCDPVALSSKQQLSQHCLYNVAEIILHSVAESFLDYSHSHACLSENLLKSTVDPEMRMPHIFRCQAECCSNVNDATFALGTYYKQEMLQNLCLGFAPDLTWDSLPEQIRNHLIQRCIGQTRSLTEASKKCVQSLLNEGDFNTHLARCDYGANMSALFYGDTKISPTRAIMSSTSSLAHEEVKKYLPTPLSRSMMSMPRRTASYIWHKIGTMAKFFAVAFVADAEYQRELNCSLDKNPKVVVEIVRVILNGIWVAAKATQSLLLPFFLFHNRKNVATLWKSIQGRKISFKRKHIDIYVSDGQYTAFIHHNRDGSFNLYQYRGEHSSEPKSQDKLSYVNTYSEKTLLLRREELRGGETVNIADYDYCNLGEGGRTRLSRSTGPSALPITRRVIAGQDQFQLMHYNRKGLIESGSYIKDGNLVRFQYHYGKVAKLDGELLRAEFVLPHMSCTVSWCATSPHHSDKLDKWISSSEVTESTFVLGTDVWENKYTYDHKCHPTIATTLNGEPEDTPPLIKYDYLDILKKPKNISFLDDNPLYSFTTVRPNPVARWLGLCTRQYPFWTSQSRYLLWKAWKNDHDYDGVVVRWMDEQLLRRDNVLKPYWRRRDWGNLSSAERYLQQNGDAVMAKVDLDMTISSWTPLAITMNDLLTFGPGGDASARTRSKLVCQEDEDDGALHVIAFDTGTWPNEGGGVSACRRDLINNLTSIKWHMVAESANDFGLPKHQIERNVHSLKVIALWGLDLMNPTHGLFQNRLDSEIEHIPRCEDLEDVKNGFIPILAALVYGARSLNFEESGIKQLTRALLNLNAYFGEGRHHWGIVWNSKFVKNAWRRLWLSKHSDNARPCSSWLATELPTLAQLDQGLELWSRYLFIFSIPVPEKMPDVFQASHHSVSASYGIVCKVKRQCILQIWDHAISWRETNLYLSSALCPLAPFVRNSLLGLLRMTSVLTLHHADTILPCADIFNPSWEVEIGTCEGRIEHRNAFRRKVDPVVNGITDTRRFIPVEIKTKTPTITMLSHVWYAKDIKTAILAADIIVNEWGFKDYQLDVYGALDKAPAYSTNCLEMISTKSLRRNVALRGEADPIAVLEQTWLFLNSSVSEGLPLALGEAALTGAPIVCTDVGASRRVLTDPQTNECYSAIVAPNDARALAIAQIHLLAMMGEWHSHSDKPETQRSYTSSHSSIPDSSLGFDTSSSSRLNNSTSSLVEKALTSLPENPTREDVEIITRRMYEQTPARKRLGMRGRDIVQKSFCGKRYLREHEQMLWIGKGMKDMRQLEVVAESPIESADMGYRFRATNTTMDAISNTSQTQSSTPLSSRLTSSRSTGITQLTSGSTDITSVLTDSVQTMLKLPIKTVVGCSHL